MTCRCSNVEVQIFLFRLNAHSETSEPSRTTQRDTYTHFSVFTIILDRSDAIITSFISDNFEWSFSTKQRNKEERRRRKKRWEDTKMKMVDTKFALFFIRFHCKWRRFSGNLPLVALTTFCVLILFIFHFANSFPFYLSFVLKSVIAHLHSTIMWTFLCAHNTLETMKIESWTCTVMRGRHQAAAFISAFDNYDDNNVETETKSRKENAKDKRHHLKWSRTI